MTSRRALAIGRALDRLAPRLPAAARTAVIGRALDSPGLRKAAPEAAAWLSLVSWARHAHTGYDALLDQGRDRESARRSVLPALGRVLAGWGVRRRIGED